VSRVDTEVAGLQVAGIYNNNHGRLRGAQVALILGLFNQADELRGLQIGLINMRTFGDLEWPVVNARF
jgi:hypothetical protein